jgi:branched-chain amino acid transport system substrate-binding protein
MKKTVVLALVLAILGLGAATAGAQDKVIKFAHPGDFTKVYTFATEEWVQGELDYLTLVNLKGGAGGHKFEALVTDTGNEPQRGIEAYERFKREGAIVFNFQSTPVSKALVPRLLADKIVLLMPFHGRSDAADGTTFPYLFSMGANYWSQATVITKYILDRENGNLKGKKIALVHIDSPFGKEPIPVFEELGRRLGFEFSAFPYPSPGNEQSATWTQVRRFKPDWIALWGAGPSQPVSIKEAIRSGFHNDHIVSVLWLAEKDMQIVGPQQGKGILRFEAAVPGREHPLVKEILSEVYDKAKKGYGKRENVGSTYYSVGINTVAPIVEGVRIAHEKFGEPITSEKLKQALETLKNFDAYGFMAPVTITPTDHEGGGLGRISQWDGTKWVPQTGWYSAWREIVWDMVTKSAEEYRKSGK